MIITSEFEAEGSSACSEGKIATGQGWISRVHGESPLCQLALKNNGSGTFGPSRYPFIALTRMSVTSAPSKKGAEAGALGRRWWANA